MSSPDQNSVFSALKAAKRLPTPPGTALRVLELCRNDETDTARLAEAVMSDPVLSARILKFANSAASGVQREVTSVRQAVLLLGSRSVKLAALGFSLAPTELRQPGAMFDLNGYWAFSCGSAVIARSLAGGHFKVDREEAFTAGLLAGIGKLALSRGMTHQYFNAVLGVQSLPELLAAERMSFGIDHAELGAQVLADWGLPEVLVNAVRYQHEPSAGGDGPRELVNAVNAAVLLAPVLVSGGATAADREAARKLVESGLGFTPEQWSEHALEMRREYEELATVFNVQVEDSGVHDLYAEAQDVATRVGMVAQLERTLAVQDAQAAHKRAATDALTGIPNRAKLNERLAELAAEPWEESGGLAVLLVDVDHFKKFNDTYGHQVGDLVLTRVARAISNLVGDRDLAARYGGEEFAVLSPQTDRKGACILAARLCRCIQSVKVPHDGGVLSVTVSVGVASTQDAAKGATPESLLSDADAQLYLAKKNGRNTWSYLGRVASQLVPKVAA
ncbi:MAG: GGDEF domain-containing protein [Phycisphaerales bacterium]|nr:GGDEF domain-containing protein [Phycisphaerales bacterium]